MVEGYSECRLVGRKGSASVHFINGAIGGARNRMEGPSMMEIGQIRYLGVQGVWPKLFKINIYIPSLSDNESGYIIDAVPLPHNDDYYPTRSHRIWSGFLEAFGNSIAPNIRDTVLGFTQTLLTSGRVKMPYVQRQNSNYFERKTS